MAQEVLLFFMIHWSTMKEQTNQMLKQIKWQTSLPECSLPKTKRWRLPRGFCNPAPSSLQMRTLRWERGSDFFAKSFSWLVVQRDFEPISFLTLNGFLKSLPVLFGRPIQVDTCFSKESFIDTQSGSLISLLSMVVFSLQWQRWVLTTETPWLQSLKYLLPINSQKKFANPWCVSSLVEIRFFHLVFVLFVKS